MSTELSDGTRIFTPYAREGDRDALLDRGDGHYMDTWERAYPEMAVEGPDDPVWGKIVELRGKVRLRSKLPIRIIGEVWQDKSSLWQATEEC